MHAPCLITVAVVASSSLAFTSSLAAQPAADRAGVVETGSLLVFPKVELRWDAAGNLRQDTFITLQNDRQASVTVKLFFINGDPPIAGHPGWNYVDSNLALTNRQPVYWSVLTGLPANVPPFTFLDGGSPPGRPDPEGSTDWVLRGLVYAWAVNAAGEQINWNHLMGTATVVDYENRMTFEYRPQAYRALAGVTGDPVGVPGDIRLDGNAYEGNYGHLLLDFQAVGSGSFSGPAQVFSRTDLSLHPVPVDLRAGGGGPVTTYAAFDVWNQNETKFSGAYRCITCWDETLLEYYDVPNHFLLPTLQTDFGRARIAGTTNIGCANSVETPLLAVSARLLYFGPVGNRAASAVNVAGGGFDGSAVVRFDAGPSPRDRSAVKKRPATDGPPQDIRISTDEGSLLIFPNVELRWESSGALVQDTFLTLQNNASGAVKVRVVFVNGDDPGPPERDHGAQPERTARDIEPGWNHVDDLVELTANQPMYWSALTGQPAGVLPFTALDPGFPPGRSDPEGSGQRVLRGFIYAWAVNDAGHEIRWNHLTGGATIVNYDEATASEYRAYASAVVDPAVPDGGVSGTPGVLNLDGAEFAPGFDLLQFDFVASGAGPFSGPLSVVADADLTIHPISIDFQEANAGPLRTNAEVRIWNQNEFLLSGTRRCITFWDQTLVSNYDEPNHFWLMHLQTNTGRARIDGESNITCVDSVPVSLLGIAVRTLSFDVGATVEHSANNLVGLGTESASIVFDPPCLPDLNGNGSVDFADILAIIGAWGPCGVPCPEDLSGNGQVDFADLLVVISAWGACP